jgi:predicted ATPase
MRLVYGEHAHEVLELPSGTVAERVAFVLMGDRRG